jgi:hypothetical protein
MVNFLFRCLYRPEIAPNLLKLGLREHKYPPVALDDNVFELIRSMKEEQAVTKPELKVRFEAECKSIGYDSYSRKICLIF